MAKNLSSSDSGSVQWICFAKAYKGWSGDNWRLQGLRCCTATLMTFALYAIIANECASSVNLHNEQRDYRRLIDGEWSFGGSVSCPRNKILWIK